MLMSSSTCNLESDIQEGEVVVINILSEAHYFHVILAKIYSATRQSCLHFTIINNLVFFHRIPLMRCNRE